MSEKSEKPNYEDKLQQGLRLYHDWLVKQGDTTEDEQNEIRDELEAFVKTWIPVNEQGDITDGRVAAVLGATMLYSGARIIAKMTMLCIEQNSEGMKMSTEEVAKLPPGGMMKILMKDAEEGENIYAASKNDSLNGVLKAFQDAMSEKRSQLAVKAVETMFEALSGKKGKK